MSSWGAHRLGADKLLDSKDIRHTTVKYGRTIVENYCHEATGWTLKVWTTYSSSYKAIQTHIQEVRTDGVMEYLIDGGLFKRVYSVKCSGYSYTKLAEAHREGEVVAMLAYGEHIKVGA